MMLRVVNLAFQVALLQHVFHCSTLANGLEVNEKFQKTQLTSKDKLGTVAPANIPESQDKNFEKQEERGFFDWIRGKDDDETPTPAADDTSATTTPIPGSPARPSTSSLMSKYGSMLGEFTKNTESRSAGDGSTAGAGSSATTTEATPKTSTTKKTKKPASVSYSDSGSGSGAVETTLKRKKAKKPVDTSTDVSGIDTGVSNSDEHASGSTLGDEESASGSGATAKTKKPATKKTRKSTSAVDSVSGSEVGSGSADLSDLPISSATSGSDNLSTLLGSSAGSASDSGMSGLLGSSDSSGVSDALAAMLGSNVGGSGSMLSFEDFMKSYGSMFGSGSGAIDLFGDPSTPQNNTINDDDILLGELYGGKEHGDVFSDIKNIKFGQMIMNITVGGQERVDSVGILVYSGEAVGQLPTGAKGAPKAL
ncbi:hypothetical protein PInf_019839 [Phytophthora infestans]|nr:hypothetical protein PInf_019839 [Phytophthora infestans]